MELPFNYIVLCIVRTLKERNMPLAIDKVGLINYFTEIIRKSCFTIEEKKELGGNFNFDLELDYLLTKYSRYFDDTGEEIVFDWEYIHELGDLIVDEMNEYDEMFIYDIDSIVEGDTTFLDILGVDIKKDLYVYLKNSEEEIENAYEEMCRLESYVGMAEVDLIPIQTRIKKLLLKKTVMLLNTKNLLTRVQQADLTNYANDVIVRINVLEDISLLLEDDCFCEGDILCDVFLRSIFTGGDSYVSNIGESLAINTVGITDSERYSKINFYLAFLDLLDKEIEKCDGILCEELIRVKYRIMNVMDSVYNTSLFLNRPVLTKEELEDYDFIIDAVYYFIDEILMYDDDKYRNESLDVNCEIIYLDNLLKKLLIETYYGLTNDKMVVKKIKSNKLYGANKISTTFFNGIISKSKTKKKEL